MADPAWRHCCYWLDAGAPQLRYRKMHTLPPWLELHQLNNNLVVLVNISLHTVPLVCQRVQRRGHAQPVPAAHRGADDEGRRRHPSTAGSFCLLHQLQAYRLFASNAIQSSVHDAIVSRICCLCSIWNESRSNTCSVQQAPAARMHTEEQQEAAWQKTVADMAAESQRRAVLARERVGLAREMEEVA